MSNEDYKHLRLYADQKLSEAGLRANRYGGHAYSVLKFCESEAQIDESITQMKRNLPRWFK